MDRSETDRLDDRVTGQDGRLRDVERWAATHETECAGRHRAINLRFDGIADAVEAVRSAAGVAATAAANAADTAQAAAVAAVEGRRAILLWVKGGFVAALSGIGLWSGTQTTLGKMALKLLGLM